MNTGIAYGHDTDLPKLDLVLDLSIIACLLGLFNTERLASEISAVTLVMEILLEKKINRRPKDYQCNQRIHICLSCYCLKLLLIVFQVLAVY